MAQRFQSLEIWQIIRSPAHDDVDASNCAFARDVKVPRNYARGFLALAPLEPMDDVHVLRRTPSRTAATVSP